MTQSSSLRFGPLGERTAHLCIDMQNLFAEDTPWHTPWMKLVLPVVERIAERHPNARSSPVLSRPSTRTSRRGAGAVSTIAGWN
jgi:hypothetical protein